MSSVFSAGFSVDACPSSFTRLLLSTAWLHSSKFHPTIVLFALLFFAVFSTPYHLFSNPYYLFSTTPSTFLYPSPPTIFLYLPNSTPIRECSLLCCYIHPFWPYKCSPQLAHLLHTLPTTGHPTPGIFQVSSFRHPQKHSLHSHKKQSSLSLIYTTS